MAEGPDMILERAFVLEVRSTCTEPKLSTVLLVGSPVPSHSKLFATLSAHEWLHAMLALVMGLKGAEILQWLCTRMIYVILAPLSTAIAWQPQHCCGLCSSQRLRTFSILRSMPPHMHLRRKRKLELLHKVHISGSKIPCKLSMIKLG